MYKRTILFLVLSLLMGGTLRAQVNDDFLSPVERYIARGDVESLSRWFDDALEVTIFSRCNESSINQARQILQTFFNIYTPKGFKISHVVEKPNIEYVLGALDAGGEDFTVTLFVSKQDSRCLIQQMKIDRKARRNRR